MLLLDVGNSAIKAQWWQGDALHYSFSCRVETGWLSIFEARLSDIKASHCHYTSGQVDQLEADLLTCLNKFFAAENIHKLVALKSNHGVHSAYQPANGIGVDRWLCLLGAAALSQNGAMIVDAGSAITVDLLCGDGQHLGGAILPGFNTSIARFKQILHRANFDHPDISKNDEPGCSTEACIQIDYELTDEAMVEQLIDRWHERLAPDAALIITGGDAIRIKSQRYRSFRIVPDLVFQGMRIQLNKRE
jgi:type III pantothenate kinase